MRAPAPVLDRSGVTTAVGVIGVGIVALLIRLWNIGDKSIWLDEAWSWRAARLPLADMVDWTAMDRHPPLYYAIVHFWIDVFGDGETALRVPSAIASAASAALLVWVGWRTGGALLALVAGGLLALHPTHVEFAQEARMYPLLGLLSLTASVALASLIERPTWWRAAAYAVLASAAMYTHYSAALLLLVHGAVIAAYALAGWREGGRKLASLGCAAFVAVALAYIPWYSHFAESGREGVGHIPEPDLTLVDLVFSALFGLQRAFDFWLAIAFPLTALGAWGVARRVRDPYVTCVAAIAVVPLLQLTVSWARTPVLDVRQASPFIAGFVFVVALGLVEAGRYVADAFSKERVSLAVTLAGAVGVSALMFAACIDWFERGPREDWRQVAADIKGTEAVFIWRGYIDEPLRFYGVERATPVDPRDPAAPEATGTGVLVLSHETPIERDAILRLLRERWVVGDEVTYPGITRYPLAPK